MLSAVSVLVHSMRYHTILNGSWVNCAKLTSREIQTSARIRSCYQTLSMARCIICLQYDDTWGIEQRNHNTYPTFPWFRLIHAANENPWSPIRGTRAEETTMEEFWYSSALVELPGLPWIATTPDPRLPSVSMAVGTGELDEWGHVLLQTSVMQFGARDAVGSAVNLQ